MFWLAGDKMFYFRRDNSQIQQTPKPAAQLPWAEPLLAAHSEEVRQVLRRKKSIEKIKRDIFTLSPVTVGRAGRSAGAVGELHDGEEAEHLRGPAGVGEGLKSKSCLSIDGAKSIYFVVAWE